MVRARLPKKVLPRIRKKAGASPGTLVHTGDRYVEDVTLKVHRFTADSSSEAEVSLDALPHPDGDRLWLEVTGVHDAEALSRLGKSYAIHDLDLEDVMNTGQRPKHDDKGSSYFVILRMLQVQEDRITEEQVALWWNQDTLISFQERPGDCLDPVRERLQRKGGRIRTLGTGYLAYAIIDAIVDHQFIVLEAQADQISDMEGRILDDWQGVELTEIQSMRRDLQRVRRAVLPLRDVTSGMLQADDLQELRVYLRDMHDHVVQALDVVDQQRDLAAGLRDLWMNAQAAHMNQVMQVLTVIATIFIPLTFLAGIYGMNFTYMPELDYRYSYPIFMAAMLVITVVLLAAFRRRGWLGGH